jgi:hypothetical protein
MTYKIGQTIIVKFNDGRVLESKIRAIIEGTNGLKLQVDFGHEETALINERQIVKD